jgi:signal transduction histidine kinase
MNAVMGVTQLLTATCITPEQSELLETIKYSSDALLTIINDILDFSRLESKTLVLEHVPVDLRKVRFRLSHVSSGRESSRLAC